MSFSSFPTIASSGVAPVNSFVTPEPENDNSSVDSEDFHDTREPPDSYLMAQQCIDSLKILTREDDSSDEEFKPSSVSKTVHSKAIRTLAPIGNSLAQGFHTSADFGARVASAVYSTTKSLTASLVVSSVNAYATGVLSKKKISLDRVYCLDQIVSNRDNSLEFSRGRLERGLEKYRAKAVGIGSSLDWKSGVVKEANRVKSTEVTESASSRTIASLLRNPNSATSISPEQSTNVELDALSGDVSSYAVFWLIHNVLGGPGEEYDAEGKFLGGVDSKALLLEVISEKNADSAKDVVGLYVDRCAEKLEWGTVHKFVRKTLIRFVFWLVSDTVSGMIHGTFKKMLGELRSSTKQNIESISEELLVHLERFLKAYKDGTALKDLRDPVADKDLPSPENLEDLCTALVPFLIGRFVPEAKTFQEKCKYIPAFGLWGWIDSGITARIRSQLEKSFPSLLVKLAGNLEVTIKGKGKDPNYQIANPIFEKIKEKLRVFSEVLDVPALETRTPPPASLKAKLKLVIDQLMRLVDEKKLSGDTQVKEDLQNGLIDGGCFLLKFCQDNQESLLSAALYLAKLPFRKSTGPVDAEADTAKYKELKAGIIETLNGIRDANGKVRFSGIIDKIVKLEVKKKLGTPASQVNHHHSEEHRKIKCYLKTGLSFDQGIGLQSILSTEKDNLNRNGYGSYGDALSKHRVFWEEFLSMMKLATQEHFPRPAKEVLIREFYPFCTDAAEQVDQIIQLHDNWDTCQVNSNLSALFVEAYHKLSGMKSAKDIDCIIIELGEVINHIEKLLPPQRSADASLANAKVLILQQWIKDISEVRYLEDQIRTFTNKCLIASVADVTLLDDAARGALLEGWLKADLENKVIADLNTLRSIQERLFRSIGSLIPVVGNYKDILAHPLTEKQISNQMLDALNGWIEKQATEYKAWEETDLAKLNDGIHKLMLQDQSLLKRAEALKNEQIMNYFEIEGIENWYEWTRGWSDRVGFSTGPIPNIKQKKINLKKDVHAILDGISPLLTGAPMEATTPPPATTTIPEERNLYTWFERLALYATLKHLRDNPKASGPSPTL